MSSLKTVMIVDDAEEVRKLVRIFLQKLSECEVIEADDGIAALSKLFQLFQRQAKQEDQMDLVDLVLIITDLEMPRMNGLEFIGSVRKLNKYSDVPIIALTSISSEKTKNRALELGCAAYVQKPFEPNEFLSVLRHYISNL